MRKSRFTQEQMVTVLREAVRATVAETAKKYEVALHEACPVLVLTTRPYSQRTRQPCGALKAPHDCLKRQ